MTQAGLNTSLGSDDTNFDSLIHQFYNLLACRTREKFLIIFDNVEDFDNILKFLPLNYRASNFAVLMTSQRPFTRESYGHVRNQPLDLMLEQEAIQLVENILGISTMDSEEDKTLLVERSGRIALVLCVMTSTIKYQRVCKSDYGIKDYLGEMGDDPIQYSDKSNLLDLTYEKSLQKIVGIAVKKLNAIGGLIEKIAVEIFDRLAYCSSTNWIDEVFVQRHCWDICKETRKADVTLPIKLLDDVQVIRLAIEKLAEFSLVQIGGNELTVHRWIQASRRLDLKDSDAERSIIKKLLFVVPDMSNNDENTSVIWQYIVDDYPDLVNEFFVTKKTLMEFPISNVDLLEKIICKLTQRAVSDSEEVNKIICRQMMFSSVDAVRRTLNIFNYEVSKNSKELLSMAISSLNVDVVKWLVSEKSCIPQEDHLRDCFDCTEIPEIVHYMQELDEFNVKISEENIGKNPFERAFNKLKLLRPSITRIIANLDITCLLSVLADSDSLKIRLCKTIEKNYGKYLLDRILQSERKGAKSEAINYYSISRCIKIFKIIRVMLSALEKFSPSIESRNMSEKYSDNNLLECLVICGRTHCLIKKDKFEISLNDRRQLNWNYLHRAAYLNNIQTVDPTRIESKDTYGRTPLTIAVAAGAYKATTVLLEKYSANVNTTDNLGVTPLKSAIQFCHPSICKILLSHGAKTVWKAKYGTPVYALHVAVSTFRDYDGFEPEEIMVELLTSKDCDVSCTDHFQNNVLHLLVRDYYATRYRTNHRVIESILSMNASLVIMQNNDGLTPLQLAKSLKSKFTDEHWHFKNLESFISEVDRILNSYWPTIMYSTRF